MKAVKLIILFQLLSLFAFANTSEFEVTGPHLIFNANKVNFKIEACPNGKPLDGRHIILVDGKEDTVTFEKGKAKCSKYISASRELEFEMPELNVSTRIYVKKYPSFLTIVPPLIAILLAIFLKEVVAALFIGIFFGIVFLLGLDDPLNWLRSPLVFIQHYVVKVITNPEKASIIVFSLMIGGMVNLLMKNGSMHHLVMKLTKFITSRRRALFTTWGLGIFIFFDDYANTLVVGNSVRPLSDRFKISREKLAYIVDSTAAPVASIALITTWIGAQVNYIGDAVVKLGIDENPYVVLLNSIGYAFYPLLTLVFIAMLSYSKRDFGPMLKYERKALIDFKASLKIHESTSDKKEYQNLKKQDSKWYEAVVPIIGLMLFAFITLIFYSGSHAYWDDKSVGFWIRFMNVIGSSDPYKALLFASFVGLLLAMIFTLARRNLKLKDAVDAVVGGFRSMLIAIVILVLAWSLGLITEDMGTDVYLSEVIGRNVSPYFLSALVFIVSAAISFATGSSWGTMALLYPIILPMSYTTCTINGLSHAETMPVFYMIVSAVLGGSVFGDHCSPISDTTILSSMASRCNHMQHVKTQLPYAVTVGLVSIVSGYLMVAYLKISPLWGLLVSVLLLYAIIRLFGKKL